MKTATPPAKLTDDQIRDEIMAARAHMGNREFWLGDERVIQAVAKTIFHLYMESEGKMKSICMGTVKEFAIRRTFMIGPRIQAGLPNSFDGADFLG